MELVGEGSVINGATPSSLFLLKPPLVPILATLILSNVYFYVNIVLCACVYFERASPIGMRLLYRCRGNQKKDN